MTDRLGRRLGFVRFVAMALGALPDAGKQAADDQHMASRAYDQRAVNPPLYTREDGTGLGA